MKTAEIRQAFLDYFASKSHEKVASASLIPEGDPTLLFVNAGMVPFKDCFLGSEKRPYVRATSCQKSLRISGKHNDLENVGRTARHHTFFEMLGNFSFGDYFKKDAILFAWEFLTENLGLDKKRLWVTIYEDDDEAEKLWKENTDVLKGRILRYGEKENFWAMGDTGPCGPCSEIHYYLGNDIKSQSEEDFRKEDGSYIEIWNLVFMQFNRDTSGNLDPLPKPSVDTGMGLERIAAVKQGVLSNYDTNELREIISFTEKLSGKSYDGSDYTERDPNKDKQYESDVALRVVADHVRAASFLISDGITPSSEGRGYVLRRLIRRACRHARNLGLKEAFLFKVSEQLVKIMGDAYPELVKNKKRISSVIEAEEKKFLQTLDTGVSVLNKEIAKLNSEGQSVFPGQVAFTLHDTYGFPLDMTQDMLSSHGLSVDTEGFEASMNEQRERSRNARASQSELILRRSVKPSKTEFQGYSYLEYESEVSGLYNEEGEAKKASAGEHLAVVCKETPFYAESGGQLGDTGTISGSNFSAQVIDTQKVAGGTIAHICEITEGEIVKGDKVRLAVDEERRAKICLCHSATHLLHFALRKVLGDHVKQAGSRVSEHNLRFDFSHGEAISNDQLSDIQEIANSEISANYPVNISTMALDEARKKGAMALFGEKYGETVRVVEIGPNSLELCGGTHVERSGNIGLLSVTYEGSISSGVRRIEALTSVSAIRDHIAMQQTIKQASRLLNASAEQVVERLEKVISKGKETEQHLAKLSHQASQSQSGDLLTSAETLSDGTKVIASKLEAAEPKDLRQMADELRNRMGSGCLALASIKEGKVVLLTAVTKDLTGKYNAGALIKEMAKVLGSKGGGKPDLAQAGGGDPAKLDEAFEKFREMIQ